MPKAVTGSMPILASDPQRRSREAGYSLLEVVVVVAIVAVSMTLSSPSLIRMIERTEARNVLKSIDVTMTDMRVESYSRAQSLTSEAIRQRLQAEMPEDWNVVVGEELSMSARGFCSGGSLVVTSPDAREFAYQLNAGRCLLSDAAS